MGFIVTPDGRIALDDQSGIAPPAPPQEPVETPFAPPQAAAPAAPAPAAPAAMPAAPPAQPGWMNPPQGELYRTLAAKYGLDNPDLTDVALKDAQHQDRLQASLDNAGNFATDAMFAVAGMPAPAHSPVQTRVSDLAQRRAARGEQLGFAKGIREEEGATQAQALSQTQAMEMRDPGSSVSAQYRTIAKAIQGSLKQAGVDVPLNIEGASAHDLKELVDPYVKLAGAEGTIALARENAEANRNMAAAIRDQGRTDKRAEKDLKHDEETFVGPGLTYQGKPGRFNKAAVDDLRATYKDLPEMQASVSQVVQAYEAFAKAQVLDDPQAKIHAAHALELAQANLKKGVMMGARARMNEKAAEFIASTVPHITTVEMAQAYAGDASAAGSVKHKFDAWVDGQRTAAASVARANDYAIEKGSILDATPPHTDADAGKHPAPPVKASGKPGDKPNGKASPPRAGEERTISVPGRRDPVTFTWDGQGWKEKR